MGAQWLLPVSPDGTRPLILVPFAFLSRLPVALDQGEIDQVAAFNREVREAWNKIIALAGKEKRDVTKKEIREVLLEAPKNLKDLIDVYRNAAANGYDFENDPDGLFSWDQIGRSAAVATPIAIETKQPKSIDELRGVVKAIIAQFKKNIEENKLYQVLYKEDKKPRREVFAQRLFYAIADTYCEANDVDLSREPDAGNGPVDFKLSAGYKGRMLVEVKKSSNPDLLHGFETQLPAYEKSEATRESIYLILQMSDSKSAIEDVMALRKKKFIEGKKVPEVVMIDARYQVSASKREKNKQGKRRR